jgi:hypothetical protein
VDVARPKVEAEKVRSTGEPAAMMGNLRPSCQSLIGIVARRQGWRKTMQCRRAGRVVASAFGSLI